MRMNHHGMPVITDILLKVFCYCNNSHGLFCVSKDRLVQHLVQADLLSIIKSGNFQK